MSLDCYTYFVFRRLAGSANHLGHLTRHNKHPGTRGITTSVVRFRTLLLSTTYFSKQQLDFAAKFFTMVRTRHGSKTGTRVEPPATLPALSPAPNSKLPAQLRFPLLVLMTWTLFGTLWSTISPFTAGDLATVSRSRDDWWNIVGLMVWKAALVAVGWYGGYDSMRMPLTEFIGH